VAWFFSRATRAEFTAEVASVSRFLFGSIFMSISGQTTTPTLKNELRGAKSRATTVSTEQPKVLFEDNHLIAIHKPCGWQTQSSSRPEPDALTWVKEYLRTRYHKPGNVFVGMVHRLDMPVSGVLLFARTSKAASRLSESIRTRDVEKNYLAWVEGGLLEQPSLWEAFVSAEANPRVAVSERPFPGSVSASMEVSVSWVEASEKSRTGGDCTLVGVKLITGRKHQIRAMLAAKGFPILGDTRYGAKPHAPITARSGAGRASRAQLDATQVDAGQPGIALLSHQLSFSHPVTKERITVEADLSRWMALWRP
jgi:23S rRNA pseudouridine1911/1915/1917 synthase